MNVEHLVYDFTTIAINSGGWMILDREFIQNKIMQLVNIKVTPTPNIKERTSESSVVLCQELVDVAKGNDPSINADDLFSKLMEITTPPPSVVNAMFAKHYESSTEEALNYLNLLNVTNGFILNSDEASLLSQSLVCPLCFNHEGIDGGRYSELPLTRRFIRLNLDGKSYGFQLKRVANQLGEGMFFKEEHETLSINSAQTKDICQLLDLFPNFTLVLDETYEKNGHGYLDALVRQKEQMFHSYSLSLPFFKQTQFKMKTSRIDIFTKSYAELPLVLDYLLAISQNEKKIKNICQFSFEKTEQGYLTCIILKEGLESSLQRIFKDWSAKLENEMEEVV